VDAGFALGKLLDEAERFDEAFAAYAHANTLFRKDRAAAGEQYDAAKMRRTVDWIIECFTPAFFAERRGWGNLSELPVFIVGMPRSGTTLVEQIAASHPAVYGAGELRDVEKLSVGLADRNDRAAGWQWDAASTAAAANAHVERLRSLAGDGGRGNAIRVTDKMPGNLLHLGLIACLFPKARVIVCRREPRDNCLSCFFQHFARKDPHLYSYDLVDCGREYIEMDRLVDHWTGSPPLKMLELRYEELVADQEAQSRRLIDFLGLPWDPACLAFHRTKRTIVTASVWQVRQPIYARSVGRWRHYQSHLGPLLDVLAGARCTIEMPQPSDE
jgi:hypothetical protein